MNRPLFALIAILVVVIVLFAMWWGWRSRSRRDAHIAVSGAAPSGELLAEFSRVFYVSTTPVGQPLSRVAVPGLRYRGRADLSLYEGGVTIEVDGEEPVHLAAAQLRGSGAAARRVGKAVEQGGLALMLWAPVAAEAIDSGTAMLESSFRFDSRDDQAQFATAIDQISHSPSTSQEGAQ